MDNDMPEIMSVSYASNSAVYDGNQSVYGMTKADAFRKLTFSDQLPPLAVKTNPKEVINMAMLVEKKDWTKRLVIMAIVDPDLKVPVEKSILMQKGPFMTDMDDQELFMTSEPHRLLTDHNLLRLGLTTPDDEGKAKKLSPIRLRDLKMTVVELAVF